MQFAPHHLYKYKTLSSEKDISRTVDIIEQGMIYAPKLEELNDPFEGLGVVPGSGYAGSSLAMAIEKTPQRFNSGMRTCRVLSLTEEPASPQMWAYYARCYTGACLQINALSLNVEPVHYATKAYAIDGLKLDGKDESDVAHARLLRKHIDWSHEQEWRAIFTEAGCPAFVALGGGNPTAVILGHKCAAKVATQIRNVCVRTKTPLYQTYISDWKYRIRIVPFGFKPNHDGTPLKKQVREECNRRGIPLFENWECRR